MKRFLTPLIALVLTFSIVGSADALNFSFFGNFEMDDDVQLINFTVGAPSTVTLKTFSYAGGINANGDVIGAGGFDPILELFDSSLNYITGNDDGSFSEVDADPITGSYYDTFFTTFLSSGNYTVAVLQYDNFFSGVSGENIFLGFDRVGDGNFTGSSLDSFVDIGGNQRTNAWAFDVLDVDSADVVDNTVVPEPATMMLFGTGMLGFFIRRSKIQKA